MCKSIRNIIYSILFPLAIFGQNENSDYVRFIAAGDLNIAHWITPIIEEKGNDYPFKFGFQEFQ